MPTYDYRCTSCDHEFEEFQSMSAKPLKRCPSCETDSLERLIGTGAGLIFKGSGFYETDYRSESYKKAAEKETKASSGDSGGSGDKSGSKKESADSGGKSSTSSDATKKPGATKASAKGGS